MNKINISIRTYDEFVNGGTIYERGVDVDPSVGKKGMYNEMCRLNGVETIGCF